MGSRGWRPGVVGALVWLGAAGASAQAPAASQAPSHETFWKVVEARDRERPCSSPADLEAARRRLTDFLDYAGGLRDEGDVAPARARLHAVMRSRCFSFAVESPRIPWPTSVASLQDWLDQGGGEWLFSYLELPQLGTLPGLAPNVVIPPDARPTLVPDSGPQPRALDRWVCAPRDASCGLATRAWVTRAAVAIDQHARAAESSRHWLASADARHRTADEISADCAATARDQGGYATFRACIENARPQRPLVPLGRFHAPGRGWLLVTGRRGHYSFCDTVSAFDLTTGDVFIDESCSALALERDGSVDIDRTNMARRHSTRVGVLPLELVREAAWMLLFRSQFVTGTPGLDTYPLPPDLERTWPATDAPDAIDTTMFGATFSTAQTSLTWALVDGTRPTVAGTLTWPASTDGAEDHAVNLLTIAESGETPGCRRRLPPALVPAPVAIVDAWADDDDLTRLRDRLAPAHRAWSALAPCRR